MTGSKMLAHYLLLLLLSLVVTLVAGGGRNQPLKIGLENDCPGQPINGTEQTINCTCFLLHDLDDKIISLKWETPEDNSTNVTSYPGTTISKIEIEYAIKNLRNGPVNISCVASVKDHDTYTIVNLEDDLQLQLILKPRAEIKNCPICYNDGTVPWVDPNNIPACECHLNDPGVPEVAKNVSWVIGGGQDVVGLNVAKLSYVWPEGEKEKTFKCYTGTDQSNHTIELKVKWAYGPVNVSAVLDQSNTTRERAMFYCEVQSSTTLPGWNTVFKIQESGTVYNYSHRLDVGQGLIRDYYVFHTASVRNGNFTAECMANNTRIATIGAVSTVEYTVEEKPSANITDCSVYEKSTPGNTIWVQVGHEEPIDCDCTITNQGFPTFWTRAQWVDGKKGTVIKEGKHVASLDYTRRSGENNKTFICQAINSAGESENTTSFTVQYGRNSTVNVTCPKYILEKTGSCECRLSDPGLPKAVPHWFDGQGNTVATGTDAVTLSVNAAQVQDGEKFYCQAVSSYMKSTKEHFEALFAYGPDSVSAVLDQSNTTRERAMFYCEVQSSTTQPGWNTVFKIQESGTVYNYSHRLDVGQGLIRDFYVFHTASVRNGNFTAECMANNTRITTIGAVSTVEYTVEEKPSASITDCSVYEKSTPGNKIWVQVGHEEPIDCDCTIANPGFPTFWTRAQWFDGKTGAFIKDGNSIASLDYTRRSGENIKTFRCQAINSAGVSENSTSFTVHYTYPPNDPPSIELTFKDGVKQVVNGSTVDIDAGENLDIKCKVDGGIPVVSNITLSYGSEDMTAKATEVSKSLTIDKTFNQVTFSCHAEHSTGHYNYVTNFLLNVLQPIAIINYNINNQTRQKIEVNEGEQVIFDCLAEGNPFPVMAINGLLTKMNLNGKVTKVGVNALRIIGILASANVSDTDTFVCTAVSPSKAKTRRKRCAENVAQTPEKKASDLIVIGAPLPTFPKDTPPEARSRPDGKLLLEVEVIAHPEPTSYVLEKVLEEVKGQLTYSEIGRKTFEVEFTAHNCRIATVKLWGVDFEVKEDTRYRFTINNGKGQPTHVFLGTRKEPEPGSEFRLLDEEHFKLTIAFSVLFVLVMVFVIVAIITYVYWIRKGKGNLKYKKRNLSRSSRNQKASPGLNPQPQFPMWWQIY